MSEPRPCRACGMKIQFEMGPNDRPIPLQRVRTVYIFDDGPGVRKLTVDDDLALYVSHFETCPKAAEFSRKTKPA